MERVRKRQKTRLNFNVVREYLHDTAWHSFGDDGAENASHYGTKITLRGSRMNKRCDLVWQYTQIQTNGFSASGHVRQHFQRASHFIWELCLCRGLAEIMTSLWWIQIRFTRCIEHFNAVERALAEFRRTGTPGEWYPNQTITTAVAPQPLCANSFCIAYQHIAA